MGSILFNPHNLKNILGKCRNTPKELAGPKFKKKKLYIFIYYICI